MLRTPAPMHDPGKIGLPDGALKKAGPLDSAERAAMDQHPRIGAELLGQSHMRLFRLATLVALAHHERSDGSGSPSGPSGEAIPLVRHNAAEACRRADGSLARIERPQLQLAAARG